MKFIAWGHKGSNQNKHTHTHSYIHESYQKAFKSMGYESYWLNSDDDYSSFDFSNSIFLTEGRVDSKIPLRKDCKYILHNCDSNRYQSHDYINLQVYTKDILNRNIEKISSFIYFDNVGKTLYQPWATDLLPNEIEKRNSINFSNEKIVYWIGSIWNGGGISEHGNISELSELRKALSNYYIRFENPKFVGNREFINKSYISPSIQGKWQVENGYIPCRVLKNISYGEFGITNSETICNLFNNEIVYDNNIEKLVEKSIEKRNNITLSELNNQINFIKENHTYINRIKTILDIWK